MASSIATTRDVVDRAARRAAGSAARRCPAPARRGRCRRRRASAIATAATPAARTARPGVARRRACPSPAHCGYRRCLARWRSPASTRTTRPVWRSRTSTAPSVTLVTVPSQRSVTLHACRGRWRRCRGRACGSGRRRPCPRAGGAACARRRPRGQRAVAGGAAAGGEAAAAQVQVGASVARGGLADLEAGAPEARPAARRRPGARCQRDRAAAWRRRSCRPAARRCRRARRTRRCPGGGRARVPCGRRPRRQRRRAPAPAAGWGRPDSAGRWLGGAAGSAGAGAPGAAAGGRERRDRAVVAVAAAGRDELRVVP